jgi:hypothetical protein
VADTTYAADVDGRLKRVCAFLIAAALAIDLAGFDCLRTSSATPSASSEVTDTTVAGPDCLCCSVAHASPVTGLSAPLVLIAGVGPDTQAAAADGVQPVPYRPPLRRSLPWVR